MAIRYHFDLYPRDDPKDGARLVRFTKLQSAEYRTEANGTGSGRFTIRASTTDAAFIDPLGLQYVRVVEENTVAVTERVVGGFWLENGDFSALDEQGTRLLTFGGAGTLAYLAREILWSRAYAYADDDIVDSSGTWHFYDQASITGGDFLGGVAFRVITEAADAAAAVVEDDDKPETAIPDVGLGGGLGAFNDSAGNAWTVPSGEFTAQVGDTVLSVIKRLMEAGLYVDMDPDTFELFVWERGAAGARGENKTGAAWAVVDPLNGDHRTVRFQAPSAGTVATGNIKSDATRGVTAFLRASTVLAGNNDVFVAETDATVDIPWHRFYPSDAQNTDTLTHIADAQLEARGDAADTLRLRMKLGTDPINGEYYPFEWEEYSVSGLDGVVMVEDEVTVHTGTGQWDYNEDTFPVAALTIVLRPGGDWDCFVDLGTAYTSMAERAFQAAGVKHHSHAPNPRLCDPEKECTALSGGDLTAGTATNGNVESGATNWSGGSVTTAMFHGGTNGYGVTGAASLDATFDFGSQSFAAGTRYVLDGWMRSSAVDHDTTTITFGSDGGDQEQTIYVGGAGADPVDLWEEDGTGADGQTWHRFRVCWTPSETRTDARVRIQVAMFASADIAVDDIALYTTTNNENAGTSPKAARCDHGHHAHSIPFSPRGDITATNVQTAIEQAAALGGETDHGALTGLGDDDHQIYETNTGGGKGVISVVAASGSTETLDLTDGNVHDVTLTADCTFTLTGSTNGVACHMVILLRQDGTGGWDVTWPASVEWVGGAAPTLQTAANAWDLVALFTLDGGTTWFAQHAGTASGTSGSIELLISDSTADFLTNEAETAFISAG